MSTKAGAIQGALSFVSTGSCSINADQAGSSTFAPAPTVTQTFAVNAVVPGAPVMGTATAGDGQATVTFTAPSSNGGAAIMLYTVTSSPSGFTGTGSSSPITVTGLTNGVSYTFTVTATNSAGTGPASAASNSVTPRPAFETPRLRPDRVIIREAQSVNIDVLANDFIDPVLRSGLQLSIPAQPSSGSASVVSGADGAPLIRFTSSSSMLGGVSFPYRVCFTAPTPCIDSTVQVEIRPMAVTALEWGTTAERGFRDKALGGLRAMPSARFIAHGLVAPTEVFVSTDQFADAGQPWSGAVGTLFRQLPAGVEALDWRVLVDATATNGDVGLYLGIDTNGNGRADPAELACASAMSTMGERCDLAARAPAAGQARYWILVRTESAAIPVRLAIFETPLNQPVAQRSLVATGPGALGAADSFDLRLIWDAPDFLPGQSRGGWLEVRSDDANSLGWLPIQIRRDAGPASAFALASGVDHRIALSPGTAHERLFIDVPPGTSRLEVSTRSAQQTALFLARVSAPVPNSGVPLIAPAPPREAADFSVRQPGGDQRIVVTDPAPGRWYVTPAVVPLASTADIVVRATITGQPPVLRSGGYFNPQRSGSGLFIHPAEDQWVAIWYTYLQDGSPTWYYLQAPAPASGGGWRSPIFRSAWNGTTNRLTAVGEATITPTSAQSFTFSFTLDGETGSEAFADFGGGCPTFAGQALNISGHWFDPVRSGSGYTVHTFSDYEFLLLLAYDGRGVPRYLVAERPRFGGSVETLALEQLRGACPLCFRGDNPQRRQVGTLVRHIENGLLNRIVTSAVFVDGVPGQWTADDAVIPLSRLRGCTAP